MLGDEDGRWNPEDGGDCFHHKEFLFFMSPNNS